MRLSETRRRQLSCAASLLLSLLSGCLAGPGPKLFPPAPVRQAIQQDGTGEQWYDASGDGKADYREVYSPAGRLTAIGYDRDQDGRPEQEVVLDEVPAGERRHLVLLLDSVPHQIAEELWAGGRFRYCPRPARVISPFPVMTDLSFSEFFGASPSPGIESEFFDGQKLHDGYAVYLREGNANWAAHTDYHLPQIHHGSAYLDVEPWFGHELREIQRRFLATDRPLFVGYCVGTSGLGAMQARDGHQAGMILVDRFCRQLMYQTQGRVRFTLLSDHGHFFTALESRRVPLKDMLARFGYRVTDRLRGPRDVVVPQFEMVSAGSIHTLTPAPVARDVVGIEGVELSAYMEGDALIVLSRDGRARIERSGQRFRYRAERGDPMLLAPAVDRLRQAGRIDADGWVDDRALFEATLAEAYPDGVARLWRAFHGLVQYTPEVIVSLEEGFHCGSPFQTDMVHLVGVHGNLRQASTHGFAITTEGELPRDIRMEDLRAALRALGVPFAEK